MDVTLFLAWEWFQWIAIRFALFMALLTLGPSIGLIAADLLLYAYRTTLERIPLLIRRKTTVVITSEKDSREEGEQVVDEVKVVMVETETVR
jgi:hypothetical protein